MLSLDTKIEELAFRSRERRALVQLGVRTVKDLISQDLRPILLLRGYSDKTYASLKKARDAIRRALAQAAGGENQRDVFLQTDVEELDLDRRVRTALERLRVATIGQLLDLEVHGAVAPPGCGPVTVQRLQQTQQELRRRLERLVTPGAGSEPPPAAADLSMELSWLQDRDQIAAHTAPTRPSTPPASAEESSTSCAAGGGRRHPQGE
jgi:DNA-directed RNA polymerase alpha subunit